MFDLRWLCSHLATFNRPLPQPFPYGPKAPRAFVTTATSSSATGQSQAGTVKSELA